MINLKIKSYEKNNFEEVVELYKDAGWANYINNKPMLENAYNNSLRILIAYSEEKIVGVIRVVGDGYSMIYIQDIIVLKEYQREGIGSALIKQILEEYSNVYQTILLTDNREETIQFYNHIGLVQSNEYGCVAFVRFSM
ncbi:GNAT family N-acetyltransferase [Anaeromicropila herbilytica]|uniref:N-acetyltransferase n=1 Tax=Anaeromicropila herbilytica TaxID=2785025 RepID=A0A7R7ELI5_9FIRM|nr:GNAT family N-acetyltransferase [Anaeromicropila herbilytica]BCN30785.1 N-acetyltransferase [Anaeromicropila herbilytica]